MGQVSQGSNPQPILKTQDNITFKKYNMNTLKKISRVYTPHGEQGFLGNGHFARPVLQTSFSNSDPFIALMDDMLDKKDDTPAGGPHPHAGFETVTLVLEGQLGEGAHKMKAGDLEMMTAGSGIVHTETIADPTKLRILQLWLNLPKKDRWTQPRVQSLKGEHVPTKVTNAGKISVYSGTFGGVTSPIKNHTPFILAQIALEPANTLRESIPGNYTTFIYVLKGSVRVGDEEIVVNHDQVGWFERSANSAEELQLKALENGTEVVLYAAEPQGHPIVSHGPFIADSMDEIKDLYAKYRAGKIQHIYDVSENQKFTYGT
jgi:redox-sensitive bicupin YhaK (pirin superfamily)